MNTVRIVFIMLGGHLIFVGDCFCLLSAAQLLPTRATAPVAHSSLCTYLADPHLLVQIPPPTSLLNFVDNDPSAPLLNAPKISLFSHHLQSRYPVVFLPGRRLPFYHIYLLSHTLSFNRFSSYLSPLFATFWFSVWTMGKKSAPGHWEKNSSCVLRQEDPFGIPYPERWKTLSE